MNNTSRSTQKCRVVEKRTLERAVDSSTLRTLECFTMGFEFIREKNLPKDLSVMSDLILVVF